MGLIQKMNVVSPDEMQRSAKEWKSKLRDVKIGFFLMGLFCGAAWVIKWYLYVNIVMMLFF